MKQSTTQAVVKWQQWCSLTITEWLPRTQLEAGTLALRGWNLGTQRLEPWHSEASDPGWSPLDPSLPSLSFSPWGVDIYQLSPESWFSGFLWVESDSECVSCSVMSNSLQPHGLQLTRRLCPWNSPGTNTRVGSHSLLQGIFPTQGSNPGLLHCR